MFVNLHTLKGTARTYQFKQLAARVHDAEHFLSQYIKELVSWSSATVGQDLEEIKACLFSYEHIARSKLRWTLNNSVVKVSKEDLLQLLPHLKGLEEEGLTAVGKAHLATLGNTLIANCYTKLNELVKEVARSLDSIARDLGKLPPELTLSPNHFLIDDKWTDRLQGTLTHLLRNAMDHGLEKPDERFRAGKSEKGRIFLRTSCEMSFLRLEIQDDGRGLNLPKITEIAMEKGLISGPLASDQETAELIFHSGFSTKSQVSDISGRGVGMDAVRALVSEGGGQVFLELDPNSPDKSHYGFAVVLLLPAEAWTVLTEEPAA
jgi:chemotaxis protein histidine kinase CheA